MGNARGERSTHALVLEGEFGIGPGVRCAVFVLAVVDAGGLALVEAHHVVFPGEILVEVKSRCEEHKAKMYKRLNAKMGENLPIPNMIPKRNPMLRILNQTIQRLHDLRQIGPPVVRVKVEIKGIHLVLALVHKNHDTGSRIGRPARLVRHITH